MVLVFLKIGMELIILYGVSWMFMCLLLIVV